jgi:hypothetical protein
MTLGFLISSSENSNVWERQQDVPDKVGKELYIEELK